MAKATFGGGCFWCVEAIFQQIVGVNEVVSGYAGGEVANPSYRDVCGGQTGHAEVIQLDFDPDQVSYEDLVDLFFRVHDPTTLNRQGADVGTQYRSIVLYHDEAQRVGAEAMRTKAAEYYSAPIVTEIAPLEQFYPAEAYHQNYYRDNTTAPYCRAVIRPKLEKLGMI